MKQILFRGAATALVTPMQPDGSLDLETLSALQNGRSKAVSQRWCPAAPREKPLLSLMRNALPSSKL